MHYVWYLKRNILILQACILLSPQLVSEHSNDCENSCLERTGPRHDTRHSLYAMWSNVGRAASLATKHTGWRWSGEIIWIVSCCCLIMCTPSTKLKMVREQWVRKLVILAPRCAGEPCQNFFRQRSSLACDAEWCGSLSWPMAARNFNNKNHNLLCCSKHILLLLFISTIIWMICIHTTKNEWEIKKMQTC